MQQAVRNSVRWRSSIEPLARGHAGYAADYLTRNAIDEVYSLAVDSIPMRQSQVKTSFAIHEVVVLTKFSKHMLNYLAREDILAPSSGGKRRGVPRRYTYEDVVLLRALYSICSGKGKIRHLKTSLAKLRAEIGTIRPGTRLNDLLFVEGDELCVRTSPDVRRQLWNGQHTFSLVVDLKQASSAVADAISVDQQSGRFSLKSAIAAEAENERQRSWASIRARRVRA